MAEHMVTGQEAAAAYDVLTSCVPTKGKAALEMLGVYVQQLRELNVRLSNHAANAGKMLDAGRADLMRFGWDRCAEAASADPKTQARLKADNPYNTEEILP